MKQSAKISLPQFTTHDASLLNLRGHKDKNAQLEFTFKVSDKSHHLDETKNAITERKKKKLGFVSP